MSSPQQDFFAGQCQISNGGSLPFGTSNQHYFAGAQAEHNRLESLRDSSPRRVVSGSDDRFGVVVSLIVVVALVLIALGVKDRLDETDRRLSGEQSVSAPATPAPSVAPYDVFDSRYKDTFYKCFEERRLKTATALRSCASRSCSSSLQLERGWEIVKNINDQQGGWVSVETKDFLGQSKRGYVLRSALSPKVLSYSVRS